MADITAVMSAAGKRRPDLLQERSVQLYIELVIEEARRLPQPPQNRPPIAPVDFIDV